MSGAGDFDVQEFIRSGDPFAAVENLRAQDPVHWDPEIKAWLLTRYDDVSVALRDDRFSVELIRRYFERLADPARTRLETLAKLVPQWAIYRDGDPHRRLRSAMHPAFVPSQVARVAPRIEAATDRLLDGMLDDEVEIVDRLASPIPEVAILALLGVPESDTNSLRTWNAELGLFLGSARTDLARYDRAERAAQNLVGYFTEIVGHRRAMPGEDVISQLLAIGDRERQMTDDEVVFNCVLLLFAGYGTTRSFLGNALVALAEHPDQYRRLRDEPGLASGAIEELLRYAGPTKALSRVLTGDVELKEHRLHEGEIVFAVTIAANRDPARFHSPNDLDLTRTDVSHLTFGRGAHSCLGASLVRLEAEIVLRALASRVSEIGVGGERPRFAGGMTGFGTTSAMLRLIRAS